MLDFWPSFWQSFTIIFVSEIADNTFVLDLIYAPKLGAVPLLITSLLALGLMNIVSIAIGYLLPMLLLRDIVDWIGFAAFILFGVLSIYDYITMKDETVNQKIERKNREKETQYVQIEDNETAMASQENPNSNNNEEEDPSLMRKCVELFGLLCISEIGDRSQIVTISIAALYDVLGVVAGTMLAYTATICVAIFIGKVLGHCISEKQMCLVGGIVFFFFAVEILLSKFGLNIL